MSRTYVPTELRQIVLARAGGRCEYCRYPQELSLLAFQVEHIVAEKHGGSTTAENLALACPFCNRFKGSDLGSIDPETKKLTPFFNPRVQRWGEHFRVANDGRIEPLTPDARVTVAVLRMNQPDRVLERLRLLEAGAYP